MQKFIIGTDNFGIGEVNYKIDKENSIINDLTIIGDKQTFEKLSDNDDSEWSWTLYPPKLYFREIPFELIGDKIQVSITEKILDNFDVALYLMEHNNIEGSFTIYKDEVFLF